MIDTGASNTCFDQSAANQAALPVINSGTMMSATHSQIEVPVYTGKLSIPNFVEIDVERSLGAKLEAQGLIALIGRDLLEQSVFVYNGTGGSFSLSI